MALMVEDMDELNDNCTDEELEAAAYKYASEVAAEIHTATGWEVNDIECDVREW